MLGGILLPRRIIVGHVYRVPGWSLQSRTGVRMLAVSSWSVQWLSRRDLGRYLRGSLHRWVLLHCRVELADVRSVSARHVRQHVGAEHIDL